MSLETKVPDHSALTKIRNRLGEDVFREVFERIVRQCQEAGLVKGRQMLTDATLIEANAANTSSVDRKKSDNSAANVSDDDSADCGPSETKVFRAAHVSTTDPDCSMVGRAGKPKRFYYKAHVTIDGAKSRIITDAHVTTGATHECTVFRDRAAAVIDTFNLNPQEWLADRGYGHGPAYEFFAKRCIRTYIPLRDMKLGRGKHAPTEGFRYIRKENVYLCPEGHRLEPHKPTDGLTRYRVINGACMCCEHREGCLQNTLNMRGKRIQRANYQDEYDAIHRRCRTRSFKRKIRERSWKMEGVFAETKVNHGLGRAQWRGRVNMQIQVYLTAITYNLKRLANRLVGGPFRLFYRVETIWAPIAVVWTKSDFFPEEFQFSI